MRERKRQLAAGALLLLLLLLAFVLLLPSSEQKPRPEAPPAEKAMASLPGAGLLPLTPPPERTVSPPTPIRRSPEFRPGRQMDLGPPESVLYPDRVEEEKRPVWLVGILVGPDGEPLEAVEVCLEAPIESRVVADKDPRTGVPRRRLEISLNALHQRLVSAFGYLVVAGRKVAATDSKGRFEVPAPVAEGTYRLTFHPSGRPVVRRTLLRTEGHEYRSGESRYLGMITLPRGGEIRGIVTYRDGGPVRGALVSYWPDDYGIRREDLIPTGEAPVGGTTFRTGGGMTFLKVGMGATETDGEGRFEILDAMPGSLTLSACLPGVPPAVVSGLRVNEGERVGPVRIEIDSPRPPVLAGRVVDGRSGEPLRARVSLFFKVAGPDGRDQSGFMPGGRALPDGTFSLGSLKPGEYTVRAFMKGYAKVSSGPYHLSGDQRISGIEIRMVPEE